MFTGLIEKTARVTAIRPGGTVRLSIDLEGLAEGVELGDSIAVNGACLTVAALAGGLASFDVVAESLRRTALSDIKPGDAVNIERALRAGDRLGGHFVQGHVDGVGTISGRTTAGGEYLLHIACPRDLTDSMIEKGSVAVDGISLTINNVAHRNFDVSVIPHTAQLTTIGFKKVGEAVNIETDMIGKYVERFMGDKRTPDAEGGVKKPSLDREFLGKSGFL